MAYSSRFLGHVVRGLDLADPLAFLCDLLLAWAVRQECELLGDLLDLRLWSSDEAASATSYSRLEMTSWSAELFLTPQLGLRARRLGPDGISSAARAWPISSTR